MAHTQSGLVLGKPTNNLLNCFHCVNLFLIRFTEFEWLIQLVFSYRILLIDHLQPTEDGRMESLTVRFIIWRGCNAVSMMLKLALMRCDSLGRRLHSIFIYVIPSQSIFQEDASWRGAGDHWIIRLGESSTATKGRDESLPDASATMGGLSRLWIGAASADTLTMTDQFKAPADLVKNIDTVIQTCPLRVSTGIFRVGN